MKIHEGDKVPIFSWCNDIEDGALIQSMNLSSHLGVVDHIALMPDCHQGYGMPIGGVIATKDIVIPNAVGSDIGCGVIALKLPIKEISPEEIKKVFGGSKEYQGGIRSLIPVGPKHRKRKVDKDFMPNVYLETGIVDNEMIVRKEYDSARKQMGTLGSGNHFIEIQKGSDNHIWIMIHSGSRNLGYKVAEYYNNLAIELNEKWMASVPKNHELAFLPLKSEEGQNYLKEMQYCVEFAKMNRHMMMENCVNAFSEHFPEIKEVGIDYELESYFYHDVAHNYASIEHHMGKNVLVHRKGATRAYEGHLCIIPGDQGSSSYICKGKGEIKSFKSCSHGAGRLMSCTAAKKYLNFEDEVKDLESKGIIHTIKGEHSLDEASSAYKDIKDVMEQQKDLVEIWIELQPLGCIKG